MAFITAEMNMEEMDDWFRVGQEESQKFRPQIVASSKLKGQLFDPATGGALHINSKVQLNQRSEYRSVGHQYAEECKQQEQAELLSQTVVSKDEITESLSGDLEHLEIDSSMHVGSVAFPDELVPENATDVYKNYKFNHRYAQLPVLEARDTIVSTIESNQVTVIQGPTGSGKTTQVPQFILDHYAEEYRYCNIVVTQPRKIAAVSIAQRVCDERGWELGSVCGFQYGMDHRISEDTRLLYCTTGVLKEKLINKKNMHEFTHIILDEVHERDIESDFLLLIVKKLLRRNSPHVKVVLMSATFDTQVFAQYFCFPLGDHLEPAPVITVGTLHHHVSEYFADDLTSRLGEVPPVDENRPGIAPEMYDMALGLIKVFDLFEEKEQGKDSQSGFAPSRGTVLIFLPGLQEIIKMMDRARPLEHSLFLDIIPLHSSITLEEQSKAFKKPSRGLRKVIISTNIAESSITVPDIKYVIDFCLTKNLCCDQETNYPKLQLEWASKANTKQRKGRAGRVSNGRVYYMVPRWFYKKVLPDYGIPEMQRSPLDSLVLKTKLFDMGEPKALLGLALSPPNLDDIRRTILSLKEVGALSSSVGDNSNPYDGTLTFIGHVLASLPVDIRIGKLLVLGHVFGVLEECLIIGAALSVKSIFASPMQARLEAYKAKLGWSDNSLSDCIAALNAYKVWENRVTMKEFARAGATEGQWGKKHYLQTKRMKEVHEMVVELEERLKRFNIVRTHHTPGFKGSHTSATERLVLKLVLCGAFYPNYAVKEETDEKEAVKFLSGNDPCRTVMVKGLPMNQGILYEKELRDIFSSCHKDPPPRISCEQSRAFVEFSWKSGTVSEGKIHPGVYYAIKIRQLGIQLSLTCFDKDETQRRLRELQKAASSQQAYGDLRTDRLKADSGIKDCHAASGVIDPGTTIILVSVTQVIECGHFWGQCDDVRTRTMLTQIQTSLNNPRTHLTPLPYKVQPGTLVAAPYIDTAEHFYRARVEGVQLQNVETVVGVVKPILMAVVFFVDFGNTDHISVSRLKLLPRECQDLPFLAVEFFLMGVRPSSMRCADGVWSQQANKLFHSWTSNKSLIAQIYSVVDNSVRIELVSKFPNGQEMCLNEELIQQGFADKAEESFLSRQNHEWRKSQKSESGAERNVTRPDSWLKVSVPSHSENTTNTGARNRGKKVSLSGPTNPLEMTFSSITLGGRQKVNEDGIAVKVNMVEQWLEIVGLIKVVKIDPDSVNTVAIDEDPQNKSSRLMVASFIGMNPAGNNIQARDTTIMPQIPGLPALVTLLFSPYTEYRTDPKRQRYIGALCGLGFDEDGVSILPDHDIELAFETVFDTDDVAMINEVRMAINIAVGTEDTVANWGEDVFVSIQAEAREKLLALLKKRRELVEPTNYHKLYKWNEVDPDTILHHNLTDTEADAPHLLRLHQAICLSEESGHDKKDGRNKEYYVAHLNSLSTIVQSQQRYPVRCELCKVTLANSHILAIHMQTERHLRNVALLHEGKYG